MKNNAWEYGMADRVEECVLRKRYRKLKAKLAREKNRKNFLTRCKNLAVTPKFIQGLGAKNYTLGAYFGDNLVFSFTSYLCTDLRIPKERSTFTTPPVDDLRNAT
ncbi:hypothetical protein HUJ05_009783 [Dendroctonus ponderosae]|nr:hypothetical protein HUJ05_009783 [Dendroctonus ponderosae]